MKILRLLRWIILFAFPIACLAQPGLGEMEQARTFIRSSYFSLQNFSFVLSALIAIVGSIHVYAKWQSGKDVTTDLPAWFFSSLFVLLTGSFLTALFGM